MSALLINKLFCENRNVFAGANCQCLVTRALQETVTHYHTVPHTTTHSLIAIFQILYKPVQTYLVQVVTESHSAVVSNTQNFAIKILSLPASFGVRGSRQCLRLVWVLRRLLVLSVRVMTYWWCQMSWQTNKLTNTATTKCPNIQKICPKTVFVRNYKQRWPSSFVRLSPVFSNSIFFLSIHK